MYGQFACEADLVLWTCKCSDVAASRYFLKTKTKVEGVKSIAFIVLQVWDVVQFYYYYYY